MECNEHEMLLRILEDMAIVLRDSTYFEKINIRGNFALIAASSKNKELESIKYTTDIDFDSEDFETWINISNTII